MFQSNYRWFKVITESTIMVNGEVKKQYASRASVVAYTQNKVFEATKYLAQKAKA
jgi:hypothetical protein